MGRRTAGPLSEIELSAEGTWYLRVTAPLARQLGADGILELAELTGGFDRVSGLGEERPQQLKRLGVDGEQLQPYSIATNVGSDSPRERLRRPVNSALQRARATLAGIDPERLAPITDGSRRELLARYAAAFDADDMDAVLSLTRS